MRVQLTRSDDGAIAVIVALLLVVLIGIAAFTTDFGLSYVAKRQMQTASDAASLAAAGQYAITPGSCAALSSDDDLTATTEAIADSSREKNRSDSSQVDYTVECSAENDLEVTYASSDDSPRILGAIFGSGDYTVSRTATASVEPATTVAGLRPWAVCNSDLPPRNPDGSYSAPLGVFTLSFTNSICQKPGGNWWTVECPEDNNPPNPVLIDKTKNGCSDPVSVVADQPDTEPALSAALIAACAGGKDEDCLESNPSRDFNPGVAAAWESLLGKSIILPVFLNNTLTKPGGETLYPVHRFVGVRICGYHWGKQSDKRGPDIVPTSGPCAGADATIGDNGDLYILVNYEYVLSSGTTTASTCEDGLGSGCDDGVRQIRLIE